MPSNDLASPAALKTGFRPGPGLLVTAAFIGPGTVVTAGKAGAAQGCGLLWTILFACAGTIILQSLAARVGIVRGQGLGEAIRSGLRETLWLKPAIVLIIAAVGAGNAAYQTGNLLGATTGLQAVFSGRSEVWLLLLAGIACAAILIGRYRVLYGLLVALVILMSVAFLTTAACSLPSPGRLAEGFLVPRFSSADLTLVLALIGTTIVPYNLFLHADTSSTAWEGLSARDAVARSDRDTLISVSLGGLVTSAIVVTASTAFYDADVPWTSIGEASRQLEPTLGKASSAAYAIGLFSAGLTSSITAPIATAYAVCGCLGRSTESSGRLFRGIACSIVLTGTAFALGNGGSPAATIIFAQLANGLLLPVVAVFLLLVASRKGSEIRASLGPVRLQAARLIIAAVTLLSVWRIITVFL